MYVSLYKMNLAVRLLLIIETGDDSLLSPVF